MSCSLNPGFDSYDMQWILSMVFLAFCDYDGFLKKIKGGMF